MPESPNGSEPYMTTREMVAEIRADVKELKAEATRLRALPVVTEDHEDRLRGLERWRYGLPPTLLIAIAGVIAALVK